MKKLAIPLLIGLAAAGFFLFAGDAEGSRETLRAPSYDAAFSQHWNDGYAELNGYRIQFPRYGEVRDGTAVAIYVTESLSESTRVKADRPVADAFPVLKLNLVEDFQTGLYDYNTMTSVYLRTANPLAGTPTKVAFSSQEWCGHTFSQLLFDEDDLRETVHSYFDGEADQQKTLARPGDGITEDTLLLWARGLAAPVIAPGATAAVSFLPSLKDERLKHRPLKWAAATLTRGTLVETVRTAAGTFEVRKATAKWGDQIQTFDVEVAAPHRVVRWSRTDGYAGELLGSTRLKYWELHNNGHEAHLAKIGLGPKTR